MNAPKFLNHLISMKRGYTFGDDAAIGKWFRSRTDDILVIEHQDRLLLICVGTQPKWREWFWNIAFVSVEWLNIGRVHGGFAKNVDELLGREDEENSLITWCLTAASKRKRIVIEGHSRGYPIAILTATQLLSHGVSPGLVTVFGCAGARVGNKRFKRNYERMLGDRTFVLNATGDPVPKLPPWGCTNGQVTMIELGSLFSPVHGLDRYITAIS